MNHRTKILYVFIFLILAFLFVFFIYYEPTLEGNTSYPTSINMQMFCNIHFKDYYRFWSSFYWSSPPAGASLFYYVPPNGNNWQPFPVSYTCFDCKICGISNNKTILVYRRVNQGNGNQTDYSVVLGNYSNPVIIDPPNFPDIKSARTINNVMGNSTYSPETFLSDAKYANIAYNGYGIYNNPSASPQYTDEFAYMSFYGTTIQYCSFIFENLKTSPSYFTPTPIVLPTDAEFFSNIALSNGILVAVTDNKNIWYMDLYSKNNFVFTASDWTSIPKPTGRDFVFQICFDGYNMDFVCLATNIENSLYSPIYTASALNADKSNISKLTWNTLDSENYTYISYSYGIIGCVEYITGFDYYYTDWTAKESRFKGQANKPVFQLFLPLFGNKKRYIIRSKDGQGNEVQEYVNQIDPTQAPVDPTQAPVNVTQAPVNKKGLSSLKSDVKKYIKTNPDLQVLDKVFNFLYMGKYTDTPTNITQLMDAIKKSDPHHKYFSKEDLKNIQKAPPSVKKKLNGFIHRFNAI